MELADFLAIFPDNLGAENTPRPAQFDPWAYVVMAHPFYAEGAKFYDLAPVSEREAKRVYIIGGGKSVESFDFDLLRANLKPHDTVIGVNAGTTYFPCDVLFYSGGVTVHAQDINGHRFPISANAGLLHQYPSGHANKPQAIVLPYFYDAAQPNNAVIAERLASEYTSTVETVEYTDRWAWKGDRLPVTYEQFAKGIRKRRLFGVGADFGTMAVCCALMWGATEIALVGFDGRFADPTTSTREFFASMWAGDQEMYVHEETLAPESFTFSVGDRNRDNDAIFGYLRDYCSEAGVGLKWLTPSLHAREGEYVTLRRWCGAPADYPCPGFDSACVSTCDLLRPDIFDQVSRSAVEA